MTEGSRVLLDGPPRYQPETPWGAAAAVLATVLVIAVQIVPVALGLAVAAGAEGEAAESDAFSLSTPMGAGLAAGGQILSLLLIWAFAGRGGARGPVLRLSAERFTPGLYAVGALAVIVLTGLLELLLYSLFPLDFFADVAWLLEGLRSPMAWATIVIGVVLAPLWEELTFRGFLLSALAKSPLGFWGGAMLSNVLWTALHAYSWAGVASVFLAGVILSWLVWRTGSIKPAIVAHAVGNLFALGFTYVFAPVPV
jgi:membrane protease YdiL (CAAX protease family)